MPEQVGADLSLFKVTQEDAIHSAGSLARLGFACSAAFPDIVAVAHQYVEGIELDLLVVQARVQAVEVRSTIDVDQHVTRFSRDRRAQSAFKIIGPTFAALVYAHQRLAKMSEMLADIAAIQSAQQ